MEVGYRERAVPLSRNCFEFYLHGNNAFYALLTEAYLYFLSEFCAPFHEKMFSSLVDVGMGRLCPSAEIFLHGINAFYALLPQKHP